ncbi:MAG: metallophosphoesterase family protein [Desulfurococcales archaeon]|nr:metallophosphoesterase family protein [Desulfurococcales archaeon]
MVRIIHITDIHCETRKLRSVLDREEFDMVIATGDFECMESLEILYEAGTNVLAVTGNTDSPHIARKLKEFEWNVGGRIITIYGLRVGGIGGIEPGYSLEKLESLLEGEKGLDILLTHYPPYQMLDKTIFGVHVGSKNIMRFIGKYQPRIVLCGHIHESRGYIELGNTLIVNPGPLLQGYYALIDVGEKTYPSLKHL